MANLLPGAVLNNRYRIIQHLGQGGMGAVYLAEDTNLPGRQVAVKENFDPSQAAQDQFKREAVILARLKHPNLPQVTDHFVLPGQQYLVMDYVTGEDLDHILARRGPLPESDVLGWMSQVFDALQYMHTWVDPATNQTMPVIHRDIKPGNIKLTPEGRILLVDFGIAKFQTGTGTISGARAASPGFSPVEQYTGGTDARTDVYALGATIYCLLTGQILPEAPELAAGRAKLIPPRLLVPTIAPRTEQVILQAMQVQAGNRYQSVNDLRQALAGATPINTQFPCPQCGMMNRLTAKFCIGCGRVLSGTQPQPRPTHLPFMLKPVAAWSTGGALVGALFGALPKILFQGGPLLELATFAGVLFFAAIGATVGVLIARQANLDAPDFLPRFGVTLVLALALAGVSGLILGTVALGGGLGLGPLVLGWLGSLGGGVGGARLTEGEAFRRVQWR